MTKRVIYITVSIMLIVLLFMLVFYMLTTYHINFNNVSKIEISEPIFSDNPDDPLPTWVTYNITMDDADILIKYIDDLRFTGRTGTIIEPYRITYNVKIIIDEEVYRFSDQGRYINADVPDKHNPVYAEEDENEQFEKIIEYILQKYRV